MGGDCSTPHTLHKKAPGSHQRARSAAENTRKHCVLVSTSAQGRDFAAAPRVFVISLSLPGVRRDGSMGRSMGRWIDRSPFSGILEKHPQVMMAARKELHFFDNKSPNTRTAEFYASNFAR